jgi:hypothetical protein
MFYTRGFVSNVGRTSLAVVLQHSHVVLTASPQGSLYCIAKCGPTYMLLRLLP